MNRIVKTKASFNLLKKHCVLPDSWDIPDQEKERIKNSNIGVTTIISPASILNVDENRPLDNLCHLVVLNVPILVDAFDNERQFISSILHEVGHAINLPKPRTGNDLYVYKMETSEAGTSLPTDDEVYADDYARFCGYGDDFAEALSLMRERGEYGFDSLAIQTRIDRLRNPNEKLQLNL
jgi:hypothetical protein